MNWFSGKDDEQPIANRPHIKEEPELSYRVRVELNDGLWIQFFASDQYDTTANGRIVYWLDVVIGVGRYDFYSIPVANIKSIGETEVEN